MGYSDERGIASLVMAGGNSFRTWETGKLDAQLEAAARHGLMVLVGLDVGKGERLMSVVMVVTSNECLIALC